MAFPVATRFFAYSFAFWFWRLTMGDAVRLLANSDAFRAVEHFAAFVGAFNLAFWLFALHVANGVPRFCARGVATRRFTYRVAYGRAVRIVALPRTLWVASSGVLHEIAS